MSKIYLKLPLRKTDILQNFDFLSLKNVSRSVFGKPELKQISLNSKTSFSGLGAKVFVAFLLF